MGIIHDLAAKLGKALKESPEFRAFAEARRKVLADGKLEKRIVEFRQKQWEAAAWKAQGKEPPAELTKSLEQMAQQLRADATAREYFQAEAQLAQLWADVQQVLVQAVGGEVPGSGQKGP